MQHIKKKNPEWKSAPRESKRFWSNPIFFMYLWGFPACSNPRVAPPHTRALPTAPLFWWIVSQMETIPWLLLTPAYPQTSFSHFPPVMSPPWSWSTTRTSHQGPTQLLPPGHCYMPSTWSRKNYSKPGLKLGINPAYSHSSLLPQLRDCKAQAPAPFLQPSLAWQQDSLHELATACTAEELQDRAFNCLKIHYPPIVT